jgi:hypothetical protein
VCCFERRPAVADVSCSLVRKATAVEIIFILSVCFSSNVGLSAGILYSLLFSCEAVNTTVSTREMVTQQWRGGT